MCLLQTRHIATQAKMPLDSFLCSFANAYLLQEEAKKNNIMSMSVTGFAVLYSHILISIKCVCVSALMLCGSFHCYLPSVHFAEPRVNELKWQQQREKKTQYTCKHYINTAHWSVISIRHPLLPVIRLSIGFASTTKCALLFVL